SEFAPDRKAILPEVVRTYEAWQKALAEKKDKAILEDLEQAYETQLDRLLATNVDVNAVNEVLEMGGPEQAKTLKAIADKYPGRGPLLNKMESAYTVWAKAKGPLDDPADLQRMLRGAGVLEFHILASSSSANAEEFSEYQKRLQERGPRYRPEDQYRWYEVPKPDSVHGITGKFGGKTWVLAYAKDPMKVLDKSRPEWKLTDAYPQRDSNGLPAVGFEFNEIGAGYFGDLTRNNIGNALCIILDEKAYSAPVIRSAISGRGIIEGKFSMDEVNYLVSTLNAGSLDARLKDTPIAVNSIGPSLGQDNRSAGFRAGLVAAACVIAFMLVYYLYAGLIADFALFLNILLILAMMAVLQATFTMAGIAGIILTIGMAVDANVLIFERMREEKEKLQSLRLIIKNGFDRALPTILDSNITTIITSIVLYYIGTEEVKGFALTLGLGLVINIFTAVFVTKVMFNLLAKWGMIKSLPMLQLIRRPNIDWVSKQKYFWGVSAVLIVMALVAWPLRGEDKYDIEFRGGTSVQIELNQPKSLGMEQVRDEVVKAGASLVDSAKALRQAKLVADGQQKNVYTLEFS
ncbi:MAG: protein translocase subunit SecD, partial [Planctomycetes bacterium]|nr:protein translocase subunit SecD [Planctomycetota bacterium]